MQRTLTYADGTHHEPPPPPGSKGVISYVAWASCGLRTLSSISGDTGSGGKRVWARRRGGFFDDFIGRTFPTKPSMYSGFPGYTVSVSVEARVVDVGRNMGSSSPLGNERRILMEHDCTHGSLLLRRYLQP